MVRAVQIEYAFHAVGQGLFCSAEVNFRHAPSFRWVYDCGTSSSQDLVDGALQHWLDEGSSTVSGRRHLHLAALSHFDSDHVSGMTRLLSHCDVDILLLPFMPLEQRVFQALGHGVQPGGDAMRFALDPSGYLASIEARVKRIVFVSPSGNPNAPDDEEGDPPGPAPDSLEIVFDADDRLDSDGALRGDFPERDDGIANGPAVSFLAAGGRLQVRGLWEFVPYNDGDAVPLPPKSFVNAVGRVRGALLRANAGQERDRALDELKELYDDQFGGDSLSRNLISLFLYTGPAARAAVGGKYSRFAWISPPERSWVHYQYRRTRDEYSVHAGLLYTGDGSLDTSARLERLIAFFGLRRIEDLSCLQVMHHGSRKNWHEGVADRLAPEFSIFSADPANRRLRHPHGEVVRDFLANGPLLVDRERSVKIFYEPSR
jgi:hypothetical protein